MLLKSLLGWRGRERRHCEQRGDEAIQTVPAERFWIASLRSQ
jgi:hypothetical protein